MMKTKLNSILHFAIAFHLMGTFSIDTIHKILTFSIAILFFVTMNTFSFVESRLAPTLKDKIIYGLVIFGSATVGMAFSVPLWYQLLAIGTLFVMNIPNK